jgi:hypothetical protein
VSGSVSGIDFLVWLFFAQAFWDGALHVEVVIAAMVAVLVPLALGGWLISRCRGWINDGSRRCECRRPYLFLRCSDHRGQWVTSYDMAALACFLCGAANAYLFLAGLL